MVFWRETGTKEEDDEVDVLDIREGIIVATDMLMRRPHLDWMKLDSWATSLGLEGGLLNMSPACTASNCPRRMDVELGSFGEG